MGVAVWWHRAVVPGRARAGDTLYRTVRQGRIRGHVLCEPRRCGRNVPHGPVDPGPGGGIRIVTDKGKADDAGRRVSPEKVRRNVLALPRILDRDGLARG